MRVAVTQYGGALGVPLAVALDSSTLPADEAATLERQAAAVTPASAPARGFASERTYEVRVEPDTGEPVTAGYADGSLPPAVRDLIRFVQAHPRHERLAAP